MNERQPGFLAIGIGVGRSLATRELFLSAKWRSARRMYRQRRRYSLKSMKLQILSDLHLEMVKPPYSWRIPETKAEVVVLAGDIGVGVMGVEWAVREAERLQKCAVYVPGNHEYYGERLNVLEKMRTVEIGSSVYVLDMDEVTLEGVRFLGATLWTDY